MVFLAVCELKSPSMSDFLWGLENSGWLRHIKAIMDAGIFIAKVCEGTEEKVEGGHEMGITSKHSLSSSCLLSCAHCVGSRVCRLRVLEIPCERVRWPMNCELSHWSNVRMFADILSSVVRFNPG